MILKPGGGLTSTMHLPSSGVTSLQRLHWGFREAGLEAGLIEAGILEASLFAEANHKRPCCDIVRPPLQENHHPPWESLLPGPPTCVM